MKGLKFLAACAAVGAVSVACAVSSLADDSTYVLGVSDYDAVNGTINVTVSDAYADLVGSGDYTLLVLSENATVTNENSSIVKQIQQGDSTILTGVKVGTITPIEEDQVFYVRVGGADEGFAAGTFIVEGTGSDNPYADSKRILGDVYFDGYVNLSDLEPIIKYAAKTGTLTGEMLQAADVTDDGYVNLSDLEPIIKYAAKVSSTVDGVKTIATKTKYVTE